MRVALISDIHANLSALDAVLRHGRRERTEAVWQMGDIVGYGPDPDAVVARLREVGAVGVMGNHDAAAVGLIGTADFNPLAATACEWTAEAISADTRAYLEALPSTLRHGDFTCVHGTLREPLWEYLMTAEAAYAHFALQESPYSIVGHTHFPVVIRESPGGGLEAEPAGDRSVVVLGESRVCVNPGGAGQPRDGDPRGCYAVLDTDAMAVTFHRVEYDITAVQVRMYVAGLPEALASRLSHGR